MKNRAVALRLAACFITLMASVTSASADSTNPVNYVGLNFSPISSMESYNYDFSTGTMTAGTATASVSSTANIFQSVITDATPPSDPSGSGTFIGTARPVRFADQTVVFTQSVCNPWPNACLGAGTFTFGYLVMRNMHGDTLDQVTNLATDYYIQSGDCGGGSPRFSLIMSNGKEIWAYIGPLATSFNTGCVPNAWQSTGNFATDLAGARWDASQVCAGQYGDTYSLAVQCANSNGLTIDSIFLGCDGGWSVSGGAPSGNQTFLFRSVQVNNATRFPN